MAERDDELEAARLYRQLPREEPPPHLDAAIRGEARRMGATHPAPLVTPTGRRTWHYPVAAAAVIVLAVAVTWHVEREQPDQAAALPAAPSAPQSQVAPEASMPERKLEAPQAFPRKPKAGNKVEAAKQADVAKPTDSLAKQAETAAPPAGASDSVAASGAVRERTERRVQAYAAVEPPETWLERIAQLRKDGKHDEADRQLAEFRKRYPAFGISPQMLEKVEKK